jgi:hypothetical protein
VLALVLLGTSFQTLNTTLDHGVAGVEIEVQEFDEEEIEHSFVRNTNVIALFLPPSIYLTITPDYRNKNRHPKLSTGPPTYS